MIGFGGFLGSKGVKGRGGTQNLAQTRKGKSSNKERKKDCWQGKKTAGKEKKDCA